MAVPASAVPTARAWLLQVDEGVRLAAGAHHVIEYLLAPPALMLPRTPAYCPGVLLWREQMIPLVDLVPLLAECPEGVPPWNHAVVLAWQDARGEPLRHGALVVRGAPVEIFVADDMACALPEGSGALASLTLSCFDHQGKAVAVLDIEKLFARPLAEEPRRWDIEEGAVTDAPLTAQVEPAPPADAGIEATPPLSATIGQPSRRQPALQYRLEFIAPAANEPLDEQYGPMPLQAERGPSAETPATAPVETAVAEATVEILAAGSPSGEAVAAQAPEPDSPRPASPEEAYVEPQAEMAARQTGRETDAAPLSREHGTRNTGGRQGTTAPGLRSPAWNRARGYTRSPLAGKVAVWWRMTVGAVVALAFVLGVLAARNWDQILSILEGMRPGPVAVTNHVPAETETVRHDVVPGRVDASATPVAPSAPPN